MTIGTPTSLQFFSLLKWIDGRPLLDTIEPYRRQLFARALDEKRADGTPLINFVVRGAAKKNNKTTDLVLAALYCLLMRESPQGSDCFILANDEDQAGDDLKLAKKLIEVNPVLQAELRVYQKQIKREDEKGTLSILPARDVAGQHGKTAVFIGYDEIHSYRTYDLFEALSPDPTRDVLQWISSYDTLFNTPGVPLVDYKRIGIEGSDPRMLFSWYSADFSTDPDFQDPEMSPEARANPSMSSWPEGPAYLEQQKRRLPTNKYRRLHLNLPGAPEGAYYDQGMILAAIVPGRRSLPPRDGVRYVGFVDMTGGSKDDACLAIAHREDETTVVDLVDSQAGKTPFDPQTAVVKFAGILKEYGVHQVTGDDYAGEVFKRAFADQGITYIPARKSKSDIYEAIEPKLNAGTVELPDISKLHEQLCSLVTRGTKIDHPPGVNNHDDWANAAAGAIWCVTGGKQPMRISAEAVALSCAPDYAYLSRHNGDGALSFETAHAISSAFFNMARR